MGDNVRVLVVGPRGGLVAALRGMDIPFAIWSERARSYKRAEYIHVAPFANGSVHAEQETRAIAAHGPFTHVIAGTEAAVVPAALARRALGTRHYAHTTAIRCHDKLHMKRYLAEHGVETTMFLDGNVETGAEEIMAMLGMPVVVKARGLSGGRDVVLVDLASGLTRERIRGRILESYVAAPEVSVESFINQGEIHFENITEYAYKGRTNVVPAALAVSTRDQVLELNRRVIKALNIKWGMTHLEIFLTPRGPLFGEIAVRPPGGYIMELLGLAWKLNAWRAFVAMEIDRPFTFPENATAFTAAVVLHPGEGIVKNIAGIAEIRAHPCTASIRVRVGIGDRIRPRIGVGVDIGRVLLRAPTRQALDDALDNVDAHFRVDLGVANPR